MRPADLAVRNALIATELGSIRGTLAVRDGRVAAIGDAALGDFDADEVLDAKGRLLIPGGVDPHTHFWEPGPTDFREDFHHGTMSCAAGGVTTTLEHPLSVPPVRDRETFLKKKEVAEQKSVIDFGLWGGLLPDNVAQLEEMLVEGAVAFKAFMSAAGADYAQVDDGQLLGGLVEAGRLGAIIGVHAESEPLTRWYSEQLARAGRTDARAIAEGRPEFAELEAIGRAIALAREGRAQLHIVHMSIASGAELVARARREGVNVSAETCAHYLYADWTALDHHGALAKCKPPLRSPESVERLWEAVMAGGIDFIASDHSPYALDEKLDVDIWLAPWGFPGAQTMLPVVISEGLIRRSWDPAAFVRFTSANAARRFGLYPQKGSLQPGADADFVLVDLDGSWHITRDDLLSKQAWSPFEGETLRGRITHTYVRGHPVYVDGEIVVPAGSGQFVRPSHAPDAAKPRAARP